MTCCKMVWGINDPRIQHRLFAEGSLTFVKALEIGQASELGDSQVMIKTAVAINLLRAVPVNPFPILTLHDTNHQRNAHHNNAISIDLVQSLPPFEKTKSPSSPGEMQLTAELLLQNRSSL